MNRLRYIAIAAAVVAVIFLAVWWQHREMVQGLPPKVTVATELEARLQAGARAYPILGTGSMAPYIRKVDHDQLKTVVAYAVASGKPFSAIRKGDLVIYWPGWSRTSVIHQAAQHDNGGWVMSGLNNHQSESFTRITEKEFVAIVERVYDWVP